MGKMKELMMDLQDEYQELWQEELDYHTQCLDKKITVREREVYGIKKIYPVCKDAVLFADIAGTTTLTSRALAAILQLGYEIHNADATTEWTTL